MVIWYREIIWYIVTIRGFKGKNWSDIELGVNSTYSKGVVLVIEKAKKETVLIAMEYRACWKRSKLTMIYDCFSATIDKYNWWVHLIRSHAKERIHYATKCLNCTWANAEFLNWISVNYGLCLDIQYNEFFKKYCSRLISYIIAVLLWGVWNKN